MGRVGGDLPEGIREVDNIYLYSLISSLDQGDNDPNRFARISLTHFLQQLTTDDGETWYYEAPDSAVTSDLAVEQRQTTAEAEDSLLSSGFEAEIEPDKEAPFDFSSGDAEHVSVTTPYVLIIDQFEELITNHPERWSERAGFFEQLEAAMQADPALWVLLVLREDYVAALDPYAPIMADKLRARYYMERMGVDAALRAIRQPAALGRRPFAPGVAEQLVDNLLRIVVSAETGETKLGQYVEPVQLQVVCYQLWEELEDVERTRGQDEGMISGTESSPHPSTSSSSQTQ
ncbi:hypothetical protein KFU94_58070 [Chloroflexi bacterium TSY]|nr:hypothetical protein [Chloroflexi bacterium TSY]